ncbi:hypothetical protein [Methyloferula stellata]|uniref:hypothetical protein n=1 Tax=Methyloferula stellata TaxID=876270 RepID=UPI00036FD135|nr:hypothetical protein [Methyloferula stellata]
MRALRDLIAIILILAMAAVPAAVSASACHGSGQAVQDHHDHHHAMVTANAGHPAMAGPISHADRHGHQAGHGCADGCLGACCSGFLDARAYGLPLRVSLHQTALPLPLDAKAGESRAGLLERPPRLL